MSSTTIVILITIGFIALLMSGKVAFSISCGLMALCMSIFVPEIPLSNVFAGFSNTVIPLIAGMCIIGDAVFQTGVAKGIGEKICKLGFAKSEKIFICVIAVVVTIQSAFMSNNGTIAMWMPLIATVAAGSSGRIRSKMCIFPAGAAACIGGGMTMAGSSAQANVNAILMELPGFEAGMGVYEMTKVIWPALILQVLFWATIGYKLEVLAFKPGNPNFDDGNIYASHAYTSGAEQFDDIPKWKKNLTLGVLLACIVSFSVCAYEPFNKYLNIGIIPVIGCGVLFIAKAIDVKTSFKNMPLDLIIGCGFSLALGTAINTTGTGNVITNAIFGIIGTDLSPTALLIVFAILAGFMTLFMNNFVPGVVLTPIAISAAQTLGLNPLPFAVVIAVAINMAIATPVGTPVNQLILTAGYKPMDYFKVGGPLWVILMVCIVVMARIVYVF